VSRPFVRYLLVGGLSVAVDLLLLVLLVEAVGVPPAPAAAASFAASVLVNFGLNRALNPGGAALHRQAGRYLLLLVANLLLTVAAVSLGERAGVPYVVAKTTVLAASTVWNYVLYRRWVFAPAAVPAPVP
jgi:putative flippase GtrA